MNMDMQHDGQVACTFPCCMSMSILHVHLHASCTCLCYGMDMDCSKDMGMQHGDGHVVCIRHVCIHVHVHVRCHYGHCTGLQAFFKVFFFKSFSLISLLFASYHLLYLLQITFVWLLLASHHIRSTFSLLFASIAPYHIRFAS
jgi:hypothetical protein